MDLAVVGRSTLEFRFPPSSLYPYETPTFFFKNENIPPKYRYFVPSSFSSFICLLMFLFYRRKVMEKMAEECQNLLGSAMIYSLTLWLTSNIAAINMNEPVYSPLLMVLLFLCFIVFCLFSYFFALSRSPSFSLSINFNSNFIYFFVTFPTFSPPSLLPPLRLFLSPF